MSSPRWPSFVPTYRHTSYPAISEKNPNLSCERKVIFITGGGRGIGRAIAKSFMVAKAEAIFIIGRSEESLQQTVKELKTIAADPASEPAAVSTQIHYAVADILDQPAVAAAFSKAIALFGRIDVLVQNAGYLDGHRSVSDSDFDDFWRAFEINVKGALTVVREFLKIARPDATLINVGSGAGHISYIPGYAAYSSSKLAFSKIIEYVQHENPQLRAFNINPGSIATDMAAKAGDIPVPDDIGLAGSFCVWLAASRDADPFKGRFVWSNWDVDELKNRGVEVQKQDLLINGLRGWPDSSDDGVGSD